MIKRVIYLGYYLKQLDRSKLQMFAKFASKKSGRSTCSLYADMVCSSLKYNISLLEYFQFQFWGKSPEERAEWAGTGFMYEYQLRMNKKETREVLSDKIRFLKEYSDLIIHQWVSLEDAEKDFSLLNSLLANGSGKIVLKSSDGQCGVGVEVHKCSEYNAASLLKYMRDTKLNLAEEFVLQHHDLMKMSPSALNTVRVFTQINQGKVDFLGARLRISVNSSVDNLAAGNMAALVNLKTGQVDGPGIYSDITKPDEAIHPITQTPIVGFQVPLWKELMVKVEAAALLHPENRSIGWDVAITDKGIDLIEGNHNWCKLLWQLPAHKGLKKVLEQYV